MTQEIKQKLEQAADALFEHKGYSFTPCDYAMRKGFLKGAQTILENPEEWGLCPIEDYQKLVGTLTDATKILLEKESQLTKYREALESILIELDDMSFLSASDAVNHRKAVKIAKEALKQQ